MSPFAGPAIVRHCRPDLTPSLSSVGIVRGPALDAAGAKTPSSDGTPPGTARSRADAWLIAVPRAQETIWEGGARRSRGGSNDAETRAH